MNIVNVISDELLDIVDRSDQVIGQKYRAEVYAQKISDFPSREHLTQKGR